MHKTTFFFIGITLLSLGILFAVLIVNDRKNRSATPLQVNQETKRTLPSHNNANPLEKEKELAATKQQNQRLKKRLEHLEKQTHSQTPPLVDSEGEIDEIAMFKTMAPAIFSGFKQQQERELHKEIQRLTELLSLSTSQTQAIKKVLAKQNEEALLLLSSFLENLPENKEEKPDTYLADEAEKLENIFAQLEKSSQESILTLLAQDQVEIYQVNQKEKSEKRAKETAKHMTRRLEEGFATNKLPLTEEQKEQVHDVYYQYGLNRDKTAKDTALKKILGPEQYKTYQEQLSDAQFTLSFGT